MEDDVGIFDPEGLLAYAAYFRDAMVSGARVEMQDVEELDNACLILQYKIGTHTLEGKLKVRYRQFLSFIIQFQYILTVGTIIIFNYS